MTKLEETLKLHAEWLAGESSGVRADLRDADLRDADLRGADLGGADLRRADLRDADLRRADLRDADLRDADLRRAYLRDADLGGAYLRGADLGGADLRRANLGGADLRRADLRGADLGGADLRRADLGGAILRDAKLDDVKTSEKTAFYHLQCPEKGSYIGYKKCGNYRIVELLIADDAKRSSATNRKCRASKAKVLSITSLDGTENYEEAVSDYDSAFAYRVGETVEVSDFDEDRWNTCSTGIHHFITRDEAVNY